jgi:RNA recognition motif-containing protein
MSSVEKQSKKRPLKGGKESKKKVQKTEKKVVPKKEVPKENVKKEKKTKKVSSDEEEEESEGESENESESEEEVKYEKVEHKDSRTLFVGMIPTEVTQEELKSMFASYGVIEEIRMMWKNKGKKIHKGAAFVQFKSKSDSEKALALDQKLVNGVNINVKSVNSGKPVKGVVVSNISSLFDSIEETIRKKFKKYEKIENIHIDRNVLVNFESSDSAQIALKEAGGIEIGGKAIKVKEVTPKGKKRKIK